MTLAGPGSFALDNGVGPSYFRRMLRSLAFAFGPDARRDPAHAAGRARTRAVRSRSPRTAPASGWSTRITTRSRASTRRRTRSTEFALPQPPGGPRSGTIRAASSVTEDGAEVWVACHASDRVYVLSGVGRLGARPDRPSVGSGPYGVALSRDQSKALVTLIRGAQVAVIDRATRAVTAPARHLPHARSAWRGSRTASRRG